MAATFQSKTTVLPLRLYSPSGCAKCEDFKGCTACSFNYTLTALPWDDPSAPCEDCTSFMCKPCGEVDAAACNECPTSMVSWRQLGTSIRL